MLSHKIFLSLIVALALATLCTSQDCPQLFVRINSKCYFVETTKVNWHKANRHCRQLKANLLTIEDEHERRLLTDHLRKSAFEESWPHSFWTSGTKLGEEQEFYWQSTGGKIPMANWLWHFGEPNNPQTEQCVAIYYNNGGYFANDAPCDYPFMYICDKPYMASNQSEYYLSQSVVLVKHN